MTELKPGWQRVKFGEVVRLNKETCKDPAAAGIERVIGLEHLEPGDLRVRSWADVADGTTFTNRVRPGQVLFGKRRAYQRKVAVADFDAVCSGDIYVFESAEPGRLSPGLLPFICQRESFFEHAVGTSAGSLSPRTNWKSLSEFEFSLPSPEEQQRIVKLLASWRTCHESALACARAFEDVMESYTSALFDAEWPRRPIGDAVHDSAFGPRFPSELYASQEKANAWTVRTTDFEVDGIGFDDIPGARLDERIIEQHMLRDGDFLLSRSGEYAGMVRVFHQPLGDLRAFLPAAFLIRFRLNTALLLPDFLAMYCQSPQGRMSVRALASGSAQPNISGTAFAGLKVPFPPLFEQEKLIKERVKLRASMKRLEDRIFGTALGMKLVTEAIA